jgi:hypothetical protein
MKTTAKCLCGSVELEIELPSPETEIAACHCSMCRTWLGGPMLAIDSGILTSVSDESSITRFQSSEWAERGFCNKCGTSLFYYLKPADQYHFPVGLLDSGLQIKFSHQIFIDEKPDYYSFSNETQNMTGEEVFAHFESGQ